MARSRALRRSIMAVVVVAAGGFAAMNPGAVKAFYEDIYPSDPGRRQALDMCFMEDHKFNRLDAAERDSCYQRALPSVGATPVPSAMAGPPNANLIDLQRAAGEGSMPRNDIRRQQVENASHSPH